MIGHASLAVLPAFAPIAQRGDGDVDVASILGYILVGAVVGILARFLVPGRDPLGIIGTIVLGILGAVIGGWLAGNFFEETEGVDWIASVLVAVVLVLIYRAVAGRRVT